MLCFARKITALLCFVAVVSRIYLLGLSICVCSFMVDRLCFCTLFSYLPTCMSIYSSALGFCRIYDQSEGIQPSGCDWSTG
ncbi:hypothetical protein B0T17DRAFT_316176 [Bombardia bombarda]|uniref:Uncharacterized protein n=1 Tax=Bombardia bombarda TaxID=252184 RepID=A0AA39WM40_9PEZI|nr:hypothetical protein B0T17DRAFT_316176 [Bombardia bombarda]